MSDGKIEELDGSELGTKDYWDQSYDTEIENYKSHGDVGEVWFDEDSQIRVINWMQRNDIPADSEIIDLGNILHQYKLLGHQLIVFLLYFPLSFKMRIRIWQWYDAS